MKGNTMGTIVLVGAAVVFAAVTTPSSVLSLDAPSNDARALFFDYKWVRGSPNGTRIQLHRPRQVDELPILYSSLEFENLRYWGYSSVVDNGTHVLMYYMVMSTLNQRPNTVPMYTALAISSDGGRTFSKPLLGLVDLGDGGKNNVIWPLESQTQRAGGDHQTGTVFIDDAPGVPAEEKYKMIGLWQGVTMAWSSPDGVHFAVMDKGVPSSGCSEGKTPKGCIYTGSDTQQVAFWDKKLKKYAAYRRNWPTHRSAVEDSSCVGSKPNKHCGPTHTSGRMVGRCLSDALDSFQGCDHDEVVCARAGGNCTFKVLGYDDADPPILDIYTNQAVPYQEHYLLFPSVYLHYPDPPAWPCGNDGLWYSRIAHSHDGTNFSYIGGDRRSWLRPGSSGPPVADCASTSPGATWDSAMVGLARGIVQREGILRMFKYGDNLKHGQCTDGKVLHNWSGNCTPPGQLRGGGYVRVELRVDGFASLSVSTDLTASGLSLGRWSTKIREWDDCTYASAEFDTVAMQLQQPSRLMLNVVVSSGGKLLIEVLSGKNRRVLSGYSAANCTAIVGDYASIAAQWDHGEILEPDSAVSLRFLLFGDVDLHSFWFEPHEAGTE